jgi:pimeloyl-ACP methyl ester carboxylesterase
VPFRIKVTLLLLAIIGFTLVIAPLLVPVPPLRDTRPAAELAYPDSRFVDLRLPSGQDLRVHVHDALAADAAAADAAAAAAGAGTPLGFVLLHGFGSQTMTWRHLLPELARWGPAVAFDRPAFGLTERPLPGDWPRGGNPYTPEAQVALTIALMDAYGMERAVLIGHSAGGSLALDVALAHPGRVAGLVLVSPAIVRGGGAPAWSRPLLHSPQMGRIGPLLMRQLAGEPGEGFLRAAYARPERLDGVDVAAYRRALGVHDWDRALWELTKASREPRSLARLPEVGVPVLVVSGEADAIVPIAESERVAAGLPNATLVRLPDCGHVAHEECPEATLAAIETWWERVLPQLGPLQAGARLLP